MSKVFFWSASIVLALTLPTPIASAKDKHSRPDSNYQDGTLVSFRNVATGSSCSHTAETTGDVDATTDDNGNTSGTVKSTTRGSTDCANSYKRLYTIRYAESTLVIAHAPEIWNRPSVLARQLPGAKIKVRYDGKHLFVKVGEKESKFDIVEGK